MLLSCDVSSSIGLVHWTNHLLTLVSVCAMQAQVMSEKMKNLSDKQVELLLKGASWLNKGASLAQQIKAKILENKLLALGILVLLIALILRQYNLL